MQSFSYYSPTRVVFGKETETQVGSLVKELGGSRVLVVYGGQSAKRSGLLDRIMACLKEENLYAVELGGVKPNPRSGLVYEGIDLCRRIKEDNPLMPVLLQSSQVAFGKQAAELGAGFIAKNSKTLLSQLHDYIAKEFALSLIHI